MLSTFLAFLPRINVCKYSLGSLQPAKLYGEIFFPGNFSFKLKSALIPPASQSRAETSTVADWNRDSSKLGAFPVTPTDHSTKKERKYRNLRDQ